MIELPIKDGVVYKRIKGWPGYCIGDDGTVLSNRRVGRGIGYIDTWKVLKPMPSKTGHSYVRLRLGDIKDIREQVGRLVLIAFVSRPPDNMECCHNNGDPTDNRLCNVRWDTHDNNCKDTVKHGRSTRGEKHGNVKVTSEQVIEIKRLAKEERLSQYKIAKIFGISRSHVSKLTLGTRWNHLTAEV